MAPVVVLQHCQRLGIYVSESSYKIKAWLNVYLCLVNNNYLVSFFYVLSFNKYIVSILHKLTYYRVVITDYCCESTSTLHFTPFGIVVE